MITQYTYFKDGGGNGSARIYYGAWDNEDKNQPLLYRIQMSCSTGELYDETNDMYKRKKEPILAFRMDNCFSQSKCEMIGYGTTFTMKQHGTWSIKWTFMDGLDNYRSYTWKINSWETRWCLTDDDYVHHTIAEFKRSGLSIKKQGVLTIYVPVAPYFLSCILLSNKILHQKLKEDEATRGS